MIPSLVLVKNNTPSDKYPFGLDGSSLATQSSENALEHPTGLPQGKSDVVVIGS
jgi:hypothetical protein